MRLVTYQAADGPRAAVLRGDELVDLHAADADLPRSVRELLAAGPAALQRAAQLARTAPAVPAAAHRLLPPIPDPQKVVCVGLNYRDHARESGAEIPAEPVIFNKFPSALIGPDEAIRLPPVSQAVDYEAELVVVLGRVCRNVPPQQALDYVAGYCCGHDVSARDWQLHKPGKQWLLGKTFDTFAPLGPWLVTADEVGDPANLAIRFLLNGQVLQDSHTSQMIFSVPELVAYVSQVCTLLPGDVIYTGTPAGVGFARRPPVFLRAGDVAEVHIDRLGVLRNPVAGPA